jgi:AraC-like DNA-binding protein
LVRLKSTEGWTGKREEFSFLFFKGGVGKYTAGPMAQRLAAGDVAVVNGGDNGKLLVLNGEDVLFWWFSLCVEHMFPLFAGNEISLLQNVTDGLKQLKLYPAASPLAKECHRLIANVPPQFNLDHRSQLLRVAAAILTEEFRTARGARSGFVRIEDHLIQVFEQLPADELLHLSVGELAAKFRCSRRHLNRLFHHYFGFSVAALRMEMRLLKASSLLRNPDAKVINVAGQCGFNHLGLFNTCFKRRFGFSPGQWRKASLEKDKQESVKGKECPLQTSGLCPIALRAPKPATIVAAPVAHPEPSRTVPNSTKPDARLESQLAAIQRKLDADFQKGIGPELCS